MLEGRTVNHTNGLQVSVDWLSFTIEEDCKTIPEIVLNMLGYTILEFKELDRGGNGYLQQIRHCIYPITILFDGKEGMGTHVDISSTAIGDVLKHYKEKNTEISPFGTKATNTAEFNLTVLANLIREICTCGHITRLDFAVDDIGGKYFTVSEVAQVLSDGRYTSKFRNYKEIKEFKDAKTCVGHTLYLGSRTSDIMLRIYDKQLEQSKKLLSAGESPIMYPWIRWELEFKREHAQTVAAMLASGAKLSQITIGILSNYFRIINLDNQNKSRCTVDTKWSKFVDEVSRLSLYLAPPAKTLDKVKGWLMRQVASSLATVVMAMEGDAAFIYKLLDSGRSRLKAYHLDLIEQAQMVVSA